MINKHEAIFRIAAFTRCTLLPTSRSLFLPLSFHSDENFLFFYLNTEKRAERKKITNLNT